MTPFWTSLFGELKDRGRNATLFMLALAAFFILLLVGAFVCNTELRQYLVPALVIPGIVGVVWMSCKIRQARRRHREQLKAGPLSDDELRKARSKLQSASTKLPPRDAPGSDFFA